MFSQVPSSATLHERFEHQASVRPRATAVECDGVWLTYRELNQEANRLARRIVEEGVGEGELVLVDVERSCDLIVSLLAVLKAGGAFLLTEDAPPHTSREAWIRSTGAQVLLTDFASGFEGRGMRSVGCYEASGTDDNLGTRTQSEGWACVASQAGWTHAAVAKRLDWARDVLALRAEERVLSSVSLHGEAVLELLLPLINGATLVLASAHELRNPERLARLEQRADCRTLRMPPLLAATA